MRTDPVEYVLLKEDNDDKDNIKGNKEQLWEIDYDKGYALDISEITDLDLISKEYKLIGYFGNIEDFLLTERGCTDIHLHDSVGLPDQIHLKDKRSGGSAHHGCTFVLQNNE
jgi:hypothetical protein